METKPKRWCAVVLDEKSRNRLIADFKSQIPEGWEVIVHHQTIDPFAILKNDAQLGSIVSLKPIAVGLSDKAFAVKVSGYKGVTNNKFPHITIAVNRVAGGKPKDSNDITNWTEIKSNSTYLGDIQNL